MASSKPIPDMSGLVVSKGNAAPAVPTLVASTKKPEPARQSTAPAAPKADPAGAGYFKAMTLKMDKARYTQLKQLCLDEDTTSQALLVEAVDMLLAQRGQAE